MNTQLTSIAEVIKALSENKPVIEVDTHTKRESNLTEELQKNPSYLFMDLEPCRYYIKEEPIIVSNNKDDYEPFKTKDEILKVGSGRTVMSKDGGSKYVITADSVNWFGSTLMIGCGSYSFDAKTMFQNYLFDNGDYFGKRKGVK